MLEHLALICIGGRTVHRLLFHWEKGSYIPHTAHAIEAMQCVLVATIALKENRIITMHKV